MTSPLTSIIDNRDDNTLHSNLKKLSAGATQLDIATAFFSLDALFMLADSLGNFEGVRILFGDDADPKQRRTLMEMLRTRSDEDLLKQRDNAPCLTPLLRVKQLFEAGKVEARCYTSKKFHAKAYIIEKPTNTPPTLSVMGSGNFTRSGLSQNIELNAHLTLDQTNQLKIWYEERWAEAAADVVTDDVLAEITRQVALYDPYILYLKALYEWGESQQVNADLLEETDLIKDLDPHVEQGFRRALKIIEREKGVMVCDGVGLGKSFVALALMERFCKERKNVLLIAPKSILDSSWKEYLNKYLKGYMGKFGKISFCPMTDFGYEAQEQFEKRRRKLENSGLFVDVPGVVPSPKLLEKWGELALLSQQADVIIIDESHNFRTPSASRYLNLMRVIQPQEGRRKEIVLLTATPINTSYKDIGAQFALITHEAGNLGGYDIASIRKHANELDKTSLQDTAFNPQLSLTALTVANDQIITKVFESVLIQRSRKTVKELAKIVNKTVLFPERKGPYTLKIQIGSQSEKYRELIELADKLFRPGVQFVKDMQEALAIENEKKKLTSISALAKKEMTGIKLAAFLLEQYRKVPSATGDRKTYLDEVHLAKLVFANTLKQFECSPPAFQGIIQSLGIGLLARLKAASEGESGALPEDVLNAILEHSTWTQTKIFEVPSPQVSEDDSDQDMDEEDALSDGESQDATGAETEAWLQQAVKSRRLDKKLKDFSAETHDLARWKRDILSDLGYLKQIHSKTLEARKQPDPKFDEVIKKIIELREADKKILIFTQSQRTAQYLETEIKRKLSDNEGSKTNVGRIDSHIEKTRAAILYAFSPNYNPQASSLSVPKKIDILISTDVLSEGVNLQEADVILSYDIHWNPVRLIQRIGRVDRRLKPELPESHTKSFEIFNILPPEEIDKIISLVGTVENRTLRISDALGLDVSFFKSTDPSGTLKEFNATYEGEMTEQDKALTEFVRLQVDPPDAATQNLLDSVPDGAFGVWENAPTNGLFALYEMIATPKATPGDLKRFQTVIGRPILILESDTGKNIDPSSILNLLSGTIKGQKSGFPSDEQRLSSRLKKLKDYVRNGFAVMNLPATIVPKLVCWLELRKSA